MKKLFEILQKLFKNKIFKKVTMSIVFVVMCSVACFLNWKAVVGAEGDNESPNNTFVFHFNEKEYWKNGDSYPCGYITNLKCTWKTKDSGHPIVGDETTWDYNGDDYVTEWSTKCPGDANIAGIFLEVQVSFSNPTYRPLLCYNTGDPIPDTNFYLSTRNEESLTIYYINYGDLSEFYFRPPTCTLNYDENTCGWPGGGNNEGPFGKIEKVETKVGSEDYSEVTWGSATQKIIPVPESNFSLKVTFTNGDFVPFLVGEDNNVINGTVANKTVTYALGSSYLRKSLRLKPGGLSSFTIQWNAKDFLHEGDCIKKASVTRGGDTLVIGDNLASSGYYKCTFKNFSISKSVMIKLDSLDAPPSDGDPWVDRYRYAMRVKVGNEFLGVYRVGDTYLTVSILPEILVNSGGTCIIGKMESDNFVSTAPPSNDCCTLKWNEPEHWNSTTGYVTGVEYCNESDSYKVGDNFNSAASYTYQFEFSNSRQLEVTATKSNSGGKVRLYSEDRNLAQDTVSQESGKCKLKFHANRLSKVAVLKLVPELYSIGIGSENNLVSPPNDTYKTFDNPYGKLDIKYKDVGSTGEFQDFPYDTKDNAFNVANSDIEGDRVYTQLCFFEPKQIELKITAKDGSTTEYLQYNIASGQYTDRAIDGWNNWGNGNHNFGPNSSGSPEVSYIKFRGCFGDIFKTSYVESDSSGTAEQEQLCRIVALSYTQKDLMSGDIAQTDFPTIMNTNGKNVYSCIYVKKGDKVSINVARREEARGYSIDSLKYKFGGAETAVPSGGIIENLTITNENPVLELSGITIKNTTIKFASSVSNEGNVENLDSDLAKVFFGEKTNANNSFEMSAISAPVFEIKLQDGCRNAGLCIGTPTTSDFAEVKLWTVNNPVGVSFTSDSSWDDGTRTFTLYVDCATDADTVYIYMDGLEIKDLMFNFKMETIGANPNENQKFAFPLYVNCDGAQDDNGNSLNGFASCAGNGVTMKKGRYGEDISFKIKAEDFAYWNFSGGFDDLLSCSASNGASIGYQGSISLDDSNQHYEITLSKLKVNGGARAVNITLKYVTATHNIKINFKDINLLVDDGNKIEVKQDSVSVNANAPRGVTTGYTAVAYWSPKNPQEKVTITLSETNNFSFLDQAEDFKFAVSDNSSQTIHGMNFGADKVEFDLTDSGWKADAWKVLRARDLSIDCHCLKPRNKQVGFKMHNGALATIYNDDMNNQVVGDCTNIEDSKDKEYTVKEVPYGMKMAIEFKPKEGYSLDGIDDAFVSKVVGGFDSNGEPTGTQSSISELDWKFEQYEGEQTYIATYDFILTTNMSIELICDKNSIPVTFKSGEGFDYYYVKKTKDGQIIDLSSGTPQIVNAEHDEKPTIDISDDDGTPFNMENGTKKELRGIITVSEGDDYYFAVGVQAGYDAEKLTVTQNGSELNEYDDAILQWAKNNGKTEGCKFYKLENVKSSVTVVASVAKRKVTVEFDSNAAVKNKEGQTAKITYKQDNSEIGGSLDVTYGNSVTFTVTLPEEYNQSDFKVMVRGENETEDQAKEVTKYQNEYKILDITENKKVYVENITVNVYTINFVGSDRAEYLVDNNIFKGTKDVEHGSKIEFKIKPKTGYKLDENFVVNCQKESGDEKLTTEKDSGSGDNTIYKCSISNIKENCTIVLEDIANITYKVTLQDVPGITYLNDRGSVVSGSMRVKYGSNFEFSVNVDDAYDDSAAGMFIVLNNGKSKLGAQKLSAGRYLISNITEDLNIKVGNIRKNTYTVTLRNEEGIDYYNSNNKVITGDNTVDHGSSFSFKVSLYPAYSDSSIAVMLGNDKLTADDSGFYTIPGIIEDKIITVTGIHPNTEVGLINSINNLPSSVNDLNDVNPVIEATRWYNSLSDDKKANVTNADVLMNLQQQAAAVHHTSNDVTIEGADWHIKLVVVPISSDMDACTRIYKKLTSEYILSLYDVYLWDTLNDTRYVPSGEETYTVTIPSPRLTNFRNPTGVHEDSNSGKVSFMDLSFYGDKVSFETNSFSAMGVVASRASDGISSLLDTPNTNIPWIMDYAPGGARSGGSGKDSSGNTLINDDNASDNVEIEDGGNISEKFKSANNRVTPQGSALRLILVLLILALLALALWVIYKKRKEQKE